MVNLRHPSVGKSCYARFMKGDSYLLVKPSIICGKWANFAVGT